MKFRAQDFLVCAGRRIDDPVTSIVSMNSTPVTAAVLKSEILAKAKAVGAAGIRVRPGAKWGESIVEMKTIDELRTLENRLLVEIRTR